MIIKICGITNLEDARRSVDLGATALGFNFYQPSPRFISIHSAKSIISALPDSVLAVGVVVGQPPSGVDGLVDVIQMHGFEQPHEVPSCSSRVWIAVTPDSLDRFPNFEVVIDVSWGTGRRADWKQLESVKRDFILSSGLTPENVGEAIRRLNPLGVDVCSGVEAEAGKKDWKKMEAFIEAAKAASFAAGSSSGSFSSQ